MSKAQKLVDTKIGNAKVVMFSKSYCPFCVKAKDILKTYNLDSSEYEIVELDQAPYEDDASKIQDYLLKLTGARSVPRVFVKGKAVGGCDDTTAAHKNGKLKQLLA